MELGRNDGIGVVSAALDPSSVDPVPDLIDDKVIEINLFYKFIIRNDKNASFIKSSAARVQPSLLNMVVVLIALVGSGFSTVVSFSSTVVFFGGCFIVARILFKKDVDKRVFILLKLLLKDIL